MPPDAIDAELRAPILQVLLMEQGRWWTAARATPFLRNEHAAADYERTKRALNWAADQGYADRRVDTMQTLNPSNPIHVYKITLKGIEKATEA